MSTSVMGPRMEGKVWQLLEGSGFIGAGTVLTTYFAKVDSKTAALANMMAFAAGKTAYLVTKGACVWTNQSTNVGYTLGWNIGILTAAGVLWLTLKKMTPPDAPKTITKTQCLGLTIGTSAIGVVLRELSFRGVQMLCKRLTVELFKVIQQQRAVS